VDAQSVIPADKKEYFLNHLKEFIEEAQDGMSRALEERVSEKNEACVLLLEKDDVLKTLKAYIEEIISEEAALCYKKLREITDEAVAWLEFEKGKDLAQKQAAAKSTGHQINNMQRRFFHEPAPYQECFTQMNLLYQFLNDNKDIPKMKTDSCKGCGSWQEDKRFCDLYECAIEIVPFGCTRWAIENVKKPKHSIRQHKDAGPAPEIIREKCGLCVYYIEDDNLCKWIDIEITKAIAGCVHHKTIRELFPYCPSCGKHINKADDFCGYCGTKAYQGKELKIADKTSYYCTNCGTLINKDDLFCGNCGAASYYG
jgi:hypothetical protein